MIAGLIKQDGEDREENDFYATHSSTIPPLLNLLGWQRGGKLIRENSCGQGHLSKPLEAVGHTVVSTDLIDRGYGIHGVDFLEWTWFDGLPYDAVIMNPPYKFLNEFVLKSLIIAPIVALFCPISRLEGRKRFETVFKRNPPKQIGVFINRQKCSKNARFTHGESNPLCYAWIVWERGYTGEPIILWI